MDYLLLFLAWVLVSGLGFLVMDKSFDLMLFALHYKGLKRHALDGVSSVALVLGFLVGACAALVALVYFILTLNQFMGGTG